MDEHCFGRRLRAERERRRITLESIAANTKIAVSLLRDLERDDLSHWPGGIFRRSFLRGYAQAIGLDPDETLAEFLEHYPDPRQAPDPSSAAQPSTRPPGAKASLRLTLADEPHVFSAGPLLRGARPRLAAAAWDAGATLALGGFAYLLLGMFWAPFGLAMLCYYVGGILTLGNTPGVCLFAPSSGQPGPPSSGHAEESPVHDLGHLEESLIR